MRLFDFLITNADGQTELNPQYDPLNVYIRLEDKIDFLVIEHYSLVKLLTELGGFASFLFGLSQILALKVAKNWFIDALTEKLFRVRDSKFKNVLST